MRLQNLPSCSSKGDSVPSVEYLFVVSVFFFFYLFSFGHILLLTSIETSKIIWLNGRSCSRTFYKNCSCQIFMKINLLPYIILEERTGVSWWHMFDDSVIVPDNGDEGSYHHQQPSLHLWSSHHMPDTVLSISHYFMKSSYNSLGQLMLLSPLYR